MISSNYEHEARKTGVTDWKVREQEFLRNLDEASQRFFSENSIGSQFHKYMIQELQPSHYKNYGQYSESPWYSMVKEGLVLAESGDVQQAEDCFRTILAHEPDNLEVHFHLVLTYFNQKYFARACEQLIELLKYDPNHPAGLLQLGSCWQNLGRPDKALNAYQKFTDYHPNLWQGYFALALWHDQNGSLSKTRKYLNMTFDAGAPAWLVYHYLAENRFESEKYREAAALFRQAVKASSSSFLSHLSLADCCLKVGWTGEAKQLFHEISASNNLVTLLALVQYLWSLEEYEDAIAVLRKAGRLEPEILVKYLKPALLLCENR